MKATKAETTTFFVSLAIVTVMAWFLARYVAQPPPVDGVTSTNITSVVAVVPPAPTFTKSEFIDIDTPSIDSPNEPTQVATATQTMVQRFRASADGPRTYADSGAKTAMNNFLWGVFPYLCILLFFIVPIIRMVTRPYSWSTRASGIFGRQLLGIASTIFHWGLVLLLLGHVVGLIGGVLGSTAAVEFFYWSGLFGGFLLIAGSSLALLRRIRSAQVRAMSRPEDYIVQCFLIAIGGIALYQVLVHRIFGIAYTASSWAASLWTLSPQPELMESASFLTKLHVFLALLFFAYFPFTKLVHFWTLPVNYLVRVPQSVRTQKYRFQRKWEFALRSDKSWLVYGLGLVAVGFLIAGGLLGSPTMAGGANGNAESGNSRESVLHGYPLYVSQCARCHGTEGYGDGPGMSSPTFTVLPRSLVNNAEHAGATYHFVSTDNGIASDDDLFRTIANGLGDSGMPAFPDLTAGQIVSLVDVLNEFRADGLQSGNPIVVPTPPQPTQEIIKRGSELFAQHCVSCHGAGGAGDGIDIKYSWRELEPEIYQRIKPANLSIGQVKRSTSAEDIYVRITTGVPGAFGGGLLMQSFETLPEEDRWAIVHYVKEKILP